MDNNSYPIEENRVEGLNIITCRELLGRKPIPDFYLIDLLIPEGGIVNISADSGKGKSLFALIIAYYVATGEKFLDRYETKQKNVLIIDQEMNENEILKRFQKIVKYDIPIYYTYNQKFLITNKDNFENLIAEIKEKNIGLIIFDTFTEIHSSDENDSGEMKAVNSKLLELTRRTNVTPLYLHHNRKPFRNEKVSQSSSRGSTEIMAKVSSHLILESSNYVDEYGREILEIIISQEKSRGSKRLYNKIILRIFDDLKDGALKWEFIGEVEEKTKKTKDAKKLILSLLDVENEITVKSITAKSEIGANNIRVALKQLIKEGKMIYRMQGNAKCYSLKP